MGTITERQRQRLRHWADRHMDEETADIFMESTPPTGWGDVATKADLTAHRAALDTKMDVLAADVRVAQHAVEAKLAEGIGGVQKQLVAVHQEMGKRGRVDKWQTVALLVAILVAVLGNTVLPRYFPPPAPAPVSAAPIIMQVPPL